MHCLDAFIAGEIHYEHGNAYRERMNMNKDMQKCFIELKKIVWWNLVIFPFWATSYWQYIVYGFVVSGVFLFHLFAWKRSNIPIVFFLYTYYQLDTLTIQCSHIRPDESILFAFHSPILSHTFFLSLTHTHTLQCNPDFVRCVQIKSWSENAFLDRIWKKMAPFIGIGCVHHCEFNKVSGRTMLTNCKWIRW